ncbi:MAG: WcbI family polysaccharide biosynthesis putative acetyltransferase, partial [Stellaceae bacterium]
MAFLAAEPPAAASVLGRSAPAAGALRIGQNLLDLLEKSAIAEYREGRVTVRRRRPAGCFVYGPYWQIPAGHYRLRFCCAARRPLLAGEPALGVEILALGRFQQVWQDFTAGELEGGRAALAFAVPPELGPEGGSEVRFEFRFFHFGNADLALAAVMLDEAQGGDRPPRRWRLFGRLRGRAIGLRQSERAHLRRWRRPGVVPAVGRPCLPLPAGSYRLRFCASAARMRAPADPVLGVAVVARSRWRGRPGRGWGRLSRGRVASELPQAWREFTAADLAGGTAEVTFAVPPELGLEAGEEMPFDFRFVHFGNADLTIGAVELSRLDAAESPCETPSETSRERCFPGRLAQALHGRANAVPAPRRTVVVVGNCQAQTVYEALFRAGALNTRIDAKYHFVELQKNLHEQGRRELAACDVLLVQEIGDWERYPLREAIPAGVPIIRFPLLHFASLWPFDHYNGPGDREAHEREWPNLTFAYLDGLLGRLRRE